MAAFKRTSEQSTKVVPWFDKNEFFDVYDGLFSDNLHLRRSAIKKITVWKSRVHQDLSIAIESTAALMSVLCNHEEAQTQGSVHDEDEKLRYLYSMALIRFVNHVTERGQNKICAVPIHELAEQYGIPQWMVRLRHEATHGNLPSIDMLYSGALTALQWLHSDFWIGHVSKPPSNDLIELADKNVDSTTDKQFLGILKTFADERCKQLLTSQNTHLYDPYRVLTDEVKNMLMVMGKTELITSILNNHIVFSNQYFQGLEISENNILHLDTLLLPEKLFDLWYPLIVTLKILKLLPFFCEQMIHALDNENKIKNHLIAGWLIVICNGNHNGKKLFKGKCNLPWLSLFKLCLQNPNKFTRKIAEVLLSKMDSDDLQKKTKIFEDLLHIYFSDGKHTRQNCSDETIYSVADILAKVQSCKNATLDVESPQITKRWQLSSIHFNWSSVPLGLLPHQNITYKCFEVGDISSDQYYHMDVDEESRCGYDDAADTDTETESSTKTSWPVEYTNVLKKTIVLF